MNCVMLTKNEKTKQMSALPNLSPSSLGDRMDVESENDPEFYFHCSTKDCLNHIPCRSLCWHQMLCPHCKTLLQQCRPFPNAPWMGGPPPGAPARRYVVVKRS